MSDIFRPRRNTPKKAPQRQPSRTSPAPTHNGQKPKVRVTRKQPTVNSAPTPKPATTTKPATGNARDGRDITIQQHVNRITELEQENRGLKAELVKLERRHRVVRDVAVIMARFASKNNEAKTPQLMDWANKIIRTLNGKQQ